MPQFDIAHMKVEGRYLILISLDPEFGHRNEDDKKDALAEFEIRCRLAGLRGEVAIGWDAGGGQMAFMGPPYWHPYLRRINLSHAIANRNRSISW